MAGYRQKNFHFYPEGPTTCVCLKRLKVPLISFCWGFHSPHGRDLASLPRHTHIPNKAVASQTFSFELPAHVTGKRLNLCQDALCVSFGRYKLPLSGWSQNCGLMTIPQFPRGRREDSLTCWDVGCLLTNVDIWTLWRMLTFRGSNWLFSQPASSARWFLSTSQTGISGLANMDTGTCKHRLFPSCDHDLTALPASFLPRGRLREDWNFQGSGVFDNWTPLEEMARELLQTLLL